MCRKKLARQNPTFTTSKKEQQRAYKQEARKKLGVLNRMCRKKLVRHNPAFKASEKEQQRAYKLEARKKQGVLAKECAEKQASKTQPRF